MFSQTKFSNTPKPPPYILVVDVFQNSPSVNGQRQMLTIRRSAHSSLQWLLRAWSNPHLLRSFQWFNVPVDLLAFLSTKFAACFNPPRKKMIEKHSILGRSNVTTVQVIQGRSNVTTVRVEPRLCDQGQGAMPTVVNQFEILKNNFSCSAFSSLTKRTSIDSLLPRALPWIFSVSFYWSQCVRAFGLTKPRSTKSQSSG